MTMSKPKKNWQWVSNNDHNNTYCIRERVDVLIPGGVFVGGVSIWKGEYNLTSLQTIVFFVCFGVVGFLLLFLCFVIVEWVGEAISSWSLNRIRLFVDDFIFCGYDRLNIQIAKIAI